MFTLYFWWLYFYESRMTHYHIAIRGYNLALWMFIDLRQWFRNSSAILLLLEMRIKLKVTLFEVINSRRQLLLLPLPIIITTIRQLQFFFLQTGSFIKVFDFILQYNSHSITIVALNTFPAQILQMVSYSLTFF